jgi:hypothetical protein
MAKQVLDQYYLGLYHRDMLIRDEQLGFFHTHLAGWFTKKAALRMVAQVVMLTTPVAKSFLNGIRTNELGFMIRVDSWADPQAVWEFMTPEGEVYSCLWHYVHDRLILGDKPTVAFWEGIVMQYSQNKMLATQLLRTDGLEFDLDETIVATHAAMEYFPGALAKVRVSEHLGRIGKRKPTVAYLFTSTEELGLFYPAQVSYKGKTYETLAHFLLDLSSEDQEALPKEALLANLREADLKLKIIKERLTRGVALIGRSHKKVAQTLLKTGTRKLGMFAWEEEPFRLQTRLSIGLPEGDHRADLQERQSGNSLVGRAWMRYREALLDELRPQTQGSNAPPDEQPPEEGDER